jgi:hypothetical protein
MAGERFRGQLDITHPIPAGAGLFISHNAFAFLNIR